MAFDQEIINGVTKYADDASGEQFRYLFPLATIFVFDQGSTEDENTMIIKFNDKSTPDVTTTFGNLTDNLSQSTLEGYVDELARQRFFFNPSDVYVFESTLNSTTTPLAATATFTGTFERVWTTGIGVTMKTDQEGTLYIDFSPDGTNVDSTLSFNYQTDRIFVPVPLAQVGRYARVRFTNDSTTTAQTYIRLLTVFEPYTALTSTLNGTISENFPSQVVRPTDYFSEVAMSKYQGATTWNKFGYNSDVDTANPEIIASFGGTFDSSNILTTADTLDVVSSSTNDTNSAGTGARSVMITGIDANSLAQTEIVNLNGTTTVTTSNTWLGANRVVVLSSGSLDTNDGTITITDNGGTVGTVAEIPASESVTQQCIFHTQINHNFLADWLVINARKLSGGGGSPRITIKGFSYSRTTDTTYEVFRFNIDTDVENTIQLTPSQPFVIGGREVLFFTAETNTNNTIVSMRFSGIEKRIS